MLAEVFHFSPDEIAQIVHGAQAAFLRTKTAVAELQEKRIAGAMARELVCLRWEFYCENCSGSCGIDTDLSIVAFSKGTADHKAQT